MKLKNARITDNMGGMKVIKNFDKTLRKAVELDEMQMGCMPRDKIDAAFILRQMMEK